MFTEEAGAAGHKDISSEFRMQMEIIAEVESVFHLLTVRQGNVPVLDIDHKSLRRQQAKVEVFHHLSGFGQSG